jgi:isoleucyl-tRNA synthetase
LKEFFNVSGVRVVEDPQLNVSKEFVRPGLAAPVIGETVREDFEFRVTVLPASGHKCARCWNFMPEVSAYGTWQNVCTRCQSALKEMNIDPPHPAESEQ